MSLFEKMNPDKIKKDYLKKYYNNKKNIYVSTNKIKNPEKYDSHWYNYSDPNYKHPIVPIKIQHSNKDKPLILSYD